MEEQQFYLRERESATTVTPLGDAPLMARNYIRTLTPIVSKPK